MNKLLLIEDDPAITTGLEALLRQENYVVTASADGKEGLEKALETKPDLILLDVNLPSLNGFDICRKLRENNFSNPVIMLTSYSGQVDKVVGLEIGADDYITKPFDNRELIARIRAQLRKYQRTENHSEPGLDIGYKQKLLAIMFTDIQDYSKIMNRNEKLGLDMLKTHNRLMNECIKNSKGNVIEITGDSFLVSFESAVEAVICAVDIQSKIKDYNIAKNDDEKIRIRIGVHLGDVVGFEGKLKGDVINIAARIQQNTPSGSVYISEAVNNAIKNRAGFNIESLGNFTFKNIQEPVELFSVNKS